MNETNQKITTPVHWTDIQWGLEPDPPQPALPREDDIEAITTRLVDVLAECGAYRLISQQLLTALRDVIQQRDRLRLQVREMAQQHREAA
jgi:hypothetical protein